MLSEGSAENIFLMVNNELVTPPPTENILVGITRDSVIQVARRELDRITRQRVVDRTELYVADEIFLTGTGAQIAPVVEVDHRPIGTGAIGPVASEIQRAYAEVVRGMRPEYMDWLTPVYGPVNAQLNGHNVHKVASNGHSNGLTISTRVRRQRTALRRARKTHQPASEA